MAAEALDHARGWRGDQPGQPKQALADMALGVMPEARDAQAESIAGCAEGNDHDRFERYTQVQLLLHVLYDIAVVLLVRGAIHADLGPRCHPVHERRRNVLSTARGWSGRSVYGTHRPVAGGRVTAQYGADNCIDSVKQGGGKEAQTLVHVSGLGDGFNHLQALAELGLDSLMGGDVGQGNSGMAGDCLQKALVVGGDGIGLVALYRDDPDDLAAQHERQPQIRTGLPAGVTEGEAGAG